MSDRVRENFKHKHAKSSWMSAGEDLILLNSLIDIGKADGNIDSFMMEGRYKTFVEEVGPPPVGTSDFRSLVPMVYQIYNSIELLLKGFEYAAFPDDDLRAVPKFQWLLDRFIDHDYPKDQIIQNYILKYTDEDKLPKLLKQFFANSGVTVKDVMATRRYINNNNFFNIVERYQAMYFTPDEGREFFAELESDILPVLSRVEILFGDIDDDGHPGPIVSALKIG